MNTKKATKRALLTSVMALVMCVVMLVGTTFAWFTDTASTGVNKIQAGNLDVDIIDLQGHSLDGKTLTWQKASGAANEDVLWEPGCTYYLTPFQIQNKGNLALKYQVLINGVSGSSKLLEALEFGFYYFSVGFGEERPLDELIAGDKLDNVAEYPGLCTAPIYIVAHMKEEAGNEYQGLSIDGIGITVVATQYTYEKDSIDDQYDKDADATIQVNSENIQDYLDGKYGSIDGMTLVLAAGNYGTLELGRATKYPGSHTETYLLKSGDVLDAKTIDEIKETIATNPGGGYGTPCYIRSMSNVTFKAAVGAQVSVAGVYAFSGHRYQDGYDYVLDRDVVNGSNTYYVANRLTNITFDGITFTAKSNIETSQEQAIINGFTFKNCTFNIGHTENNSDYIALRYYNENNNGNVRNLVVDNCKFNNCRQGVYTNHVYGVSVTNSTFDNIGYHAIAVQDGAACDHGKVVITKNTFTNIGANAIRFDKPGAGTQITIKENGATGIASNRYAIQATELVDGITYDISNNTWNGAAVSHNQFNDKSINP